MSEKEKIDFTWENIVNKLYILNEEFDYKEVKKVEKEIRVFDNNLKKKIREINSTLDYTDFNNKEELKKELEELLRYIEDYVKFLENFINLEPNSKKGYYNYLKSVIGFL